jgi:hypothetical protein
MKKKTSLVLLTAVLAAGAYGWDFSFSTGGGSLIGGVFTRYSLAANGIREGATVKGDIIQEINKFNYGGFVFFDATFGEFSVFLQNNVNNFSETTELSVLNSSSSGMGRETMFGFSLLGKYPFVLSEKFTWFPLLGVEYQISLRQSRTQPDGFVYDRTDGLREKNADGKAYKLSDWNAFWINLGIGVDFTLTTIFFIRGEFLYSFRLMTPYEQDALVITKNMTGDSDPKLGGFTSGPALRMAVGYKFLTL